MVTTASATFPAGMLDDISFLKMASVSKTMLGLVEEVRFEISDCWYNVVSTLTG
jgi:hypothetical protein